MTDEQRMSRHKEVIESSAKKLQEYIVFGEDYGQNFNVTIWEETYAFFYLENPENGIIVYEPEKYMTFTPLPDYSDFTISEIKGRSMQHHLNKVE